MLYYLLPKTNHPINLSINLSHDECQIYNTTSLYDYFIELNNRLYNLLINNTSDSEKQLLQNINYSHNVLLIHNDIYFNKYEEIIYDFIEFIQLFKSNFNLTNDFQNILLVTKNNLIFEKYFHYLNTKYNLNLINIHSDINQNFSSFKYNFVFYEIPFFNKNNYNAYHIYFIYILDIIPSFLHINSKCLIKINYMFYKPVLDFIYYLSSIFDKVYIIKPTIINTNDYKYIYCNNYLGNTNNNHNYIRDFIKRYKYDTYIHGLIDYDIPDFFYNKFNDINLIIGQQQLEMLKHINTIIKGYNKNTNLEEFCIKHLKKYKDWIKKLDVPDDLFDE